MCGICVSIHITTQIGAENTKFATNICSEKLKNRGPNYYEDLSFKFNENVSLTFNASVLHLRGSTVACLPYRDEYGNLLLWNGEIFDGNLGPITDSSDTQVLSDALKHCKDEFGILDVFASIKGPWAFIYFQKLHGCLWFGRDILGRRSLLWSVTQSPSALSFSISSVAVDDHNWNDVLCEGLYCLDTDSSKQQNKIILNKYLWSSTPSGQQCLLQNSFKDNEQLKIVTSSNSVQSPIELPPNFESLYDEPIYNSVPVNDNNYAQWFENLLETELVKSAVLQFSNVLSESVRQRVTNHQFICKNCYVNYPGNCDRMKDECLHSSVGVLFSGGLDSIVLATLADRHIPIGIPIDLINVAFDCPEKKTLSKRNQVKEQDCKIKSSFMTPDRITGLKGLAELNNIRPTRNWNFVEVNVTQEELKLERSRSIQSLISPSCTVLDDSIGCALWFAARGKGALHNSDDLFYCSPSRVLLLGMGADELLAGYSRHRGTFSSRGWTALQNELALELDRIGIRNLGRDDRIISDHGREARFPFLDEKVVSFLNRTPLQLKINFNHPRGVGEKLLLRLLAYSIGLREAAFFAKRAIQFGSRIARSEVSKEKGSDICSRLTSVTKIQ